MLDRRRGRAAVEQLVLVDGAYSLRGRHAEVVRPSMFPNVAVDLTKVW